MLTASAATAGMTTTVSMSYIARVLKLRLLARLVMSGCRTMRLKKLQIIEGMFVSRLMVASMTLVRCPLVTLARKIV